MRIKRIATLINKALGKRVKQATYSYSDILLYWIYSNICGAERLEDTVFLKSHLQSIPNLANPSPDRISGILRSLAQPETAITSKNDITHQFNTNLPLNGLMIDVAKRLNTIKGTTLDYDNVIIETEKHDATWTYKKIKGYQPGVAFIDKTPVYIEARSGNSPAKYKMSDTLKTCFKLLKSKDIKIKRFRSDSAAYQQSVINMLERKEIKFFIRANTSNYLRSEAKLISNWEKTTYNGFLFELGEIEYFPFANSKKAYRAIIKRQLINDTYTYYSILTNDWKMPKAEVLHFYNQRGAIERNFDDLKNNFNWKRIPFSFLNENLVFMLVSAIASIVYNYIIDKFSEKVDFVKSTFRLKNFIFHFITIGSLWKKGKLKLFTNKNYTKIFT